MIALLVLVACGDGDDTAGPIDYSGDGCMFTVNTEWTRLSDGTYVASSCVDDSRAQDGVLDFSACCPDPFTVVGVLSEYEVVCG